MGIPNQFVAVHATIRISSSALVADVGGKCHLPRHGYLYISPIRIGIRFLIVFWAKLVLFPGVRKTTVQPYFEPVVAIGGSQVFIQVQVCGRILFRHLVHGQITHIVVEADVGMCPDVELLVAQGCVVSESGIRTPVAVDVIGVSVYIGAPMNINKSINGTKVHKRASIPQFSTSNTRNNRVDIKTTPN